MSLHSLFDRRRAFCLAVAFAVCLFPVAAARGAPAGGLQDLIERHATDLAALERYHRVPLSDERSKRLRRFLEEEEAALGRIDFDALDQEGRIDYLLFRNHLRSRIRELGHEEKRAAQVATFLPFAGAIVGLEESRRRFEPIDPERTAAVLVDVAKQAEDQEKRIKGEMLAARHVVQRAARRIDDLRDALKRWYGFYAGYDPEFTWWMRQPHEDAQKKLESYAGFLEKRLEVAGVDEGDQVIGDPIGRQALLDALESEMVPYAPEELLEIAAKEFAWCEAEYRRAAAELGFGDDWRKALDHVKKLHVKPGEQPKLITDLAAEAVKFLEDRDLVTIPPLAKETWRVEMMSPERQRVNPFFTGGEVISVSYPTDTMSHEEKLMTMRGNNIHFSRATVQHELIPGHHLQGFMAARHRTHRRPFRTPFLVEGWALYWEMLLWDLKFPKSPEDRIGMLFWRSHRCARIVFSLRFHLGEITAEEAVQYLVDRVGHEPSNARAEVRRSVSGQYGPLYQAAYMLGGLQIRALRRELVDSGKMKDRDFHDAILKENAIPIELIRASLTGEPLERSFGSRWRFHDGDRLAAGEARGAGGAVVGGRTAVADGRAVPSVPRGQRRPMVFRDRVEPRWFAGGTKFWYRVDLPEEKREFILVDAVGRTRGPAFDHERLAKSLGEAAGRAVEPGRLPFDSIEIAEDGKSVRLSGENAAWRLDLETYAVTALAVEPRPAREEAPGGDERRRRRFQGQGQGRGQGSGPGGRGSRSPDGQWEAFVRGDNLWIRDVRSGAERALTHDANPSDTYARDVRRARAIEMEYGRPDGEAAEPEAHWSPDSRRVVAMRTRAGTERLVYLVESSPRDQLQPRLQSYPYLKPGDEVPVQRPRLFDAESGREIPIDGSLFPRPWSIDGIRWSPDSLRFTLLYNERGHQVLRLIAVDAATGGATAIIDERSPTFIDYAGKRFISHVERTGEIIWMSERDGWNHLYLHDARNGQVKSQVTRGEWVVRAVDRVDEEKRQVWFQAGGIRPGEDPYHVHHCRVGFDGTGLVVLTDGDGTHSVQYSPDRRWLVDAWSRVDLPPVTALRSAEDGKLVLELETADASALLATGWRPPERFVAKGRDGETDIHGIIHWPLRFDAGQKYPVIESIYAGPQGAFVPKSFRPSYRQEDLAALGFIVVQIDGMGTSNRSKKFHDVAWKNLGDSGFPDRILWMKAAAARHPSMDLTRVGIYGGSAGGQNAVRGLLAHGEFYKVGAADCGCHDNRMDKVWWNELWMGWPVGPHYDEQSNVTQAHRLQGKLLLTVGELDRNVDPASTMQLVNALIKADKDFDLILIPGAGHGAGESDYGRRRRAEFFVRHLQGIEPPRPAPVEAAARSF